MRKKMKILILAAAATIATSLALPAAADAYYYGYGYPYYGHGFGHGFHGYGGYGYGPYGYGGFAVDGSVRIEVNPKDAREEIEVYVDGGLAGVVNDYDGALQRLRLPPGKHELELKLDGYQTQKMTIFVERGGSFHIRGDMIPEKAGAMLAPFGCGALDEAMAHSLASEPWRNSRRKTTGPTATRLAIFRWLSSTRDWRLCPWCPKTRDASD